MSDSAVINPVALGPPLGNTAVMAATRPDLSDLAGQLGLGSKQARDFFFSRIYEPPEQGGGVSLVGPFMGAPYAAMLLENLIARGVTTVFFLGWCGSVSPGARTGDILIPDGAFSDEGTSLHYDDTAALTLLKSDETLNRKLENALNAQGISFKTGPCWTTDAIYRETPQKIDAFREKGALAVDMELSALLTVAAFRGIRLAAVLVVSDEVWTHTWKPGFTNKIFKKSRRKAAQALATLMKGWDHE